MLKSTMFKWAAVLLIVPAIPVLAKTVTSSRTSAVKPAAVKPATGADSKKLADAIAALSKPTHGTAAAPAKAGAKAIAKPAVHTALAGATSTRTHVVVTGETYS